MIRGAKRDHHAAMLHGCGRQSGLDLS